MSSLTVGVIANPASGRDIRRLVTGGSVFDNAEKASMVFRLMAGLGAAGVERVLMMPAADGVSSGVIRRYRNRGHVLAGARFPELETLDWTPTGTDRGHRSRRRGDVRGRRGGDRRAGRRRHASARRRECGEVPLCALSTGTNNAFPELREATVAGLAVGLLATERVDPSEAAIERDARSAVQHRGAGDRSRAGRRGRGEPRTLRRRAGRVAARGGLGAGRRACRARRRSASPRSPPSSSPCAAARRASTCASRRRRRPPSCWTCRWRPGFVIPMGIREYRRLALGDVVELTPGSGTIALDGEREFARSAGRPPSSVELDTGPSAHRRRRGDGGRRPGRVS